MNVKAENHESPQAGDVVKYVGAALLVAAGLVAYYWFATWATPLRALLPVAGLVAAGAVFAMTAKGRKAREYFAEARFELRKVIWPTREQTMRTSVMVIIVVVIISLLLAVIDFFLQGGVRLLLRL
jgi:preprotein translocase subunit SecE